jgi:hypothetical protein
MSALRNEIKVPRRHRPKSNPPKLPQRHNWMTGSILAALALVEGGTSLYKAATRYNIPRKTLGLCSS